MKAELSDVERACAIYTKRNLAFYDWWVLGFSNRRLWRCPTEKILDLYRAHITANHLEVGVGTGFFTAKTMPPPPSRLALLDLSRDCLDRAAKTLAEFHPEIHQENLLEPLPPLGERFDSIAVNYVLHCLPGRLEKKASTVFDHLIAFLDDEGVVFGSTILGKDLPVPLAAKLAMRAYNRKGILSNAQDSLGGIMEALSARFRTFNVEVSGCVVLFSGKGLRDAYRHTRPPGEAASAAKAASNAQI